MGSNAQKTPFARSMNEFSEQKVREQITKLGKALPCSVVAVNGSIVTVAFAVTSAYTLPQVTIPMFGPEYIRYPTQVGDLGVVYPCDVYIGGVSGLGGGVADMSMPGNLSALVFFPIANANWSVTDDPNAVVIYGPDGAVIRTTNKNCSVTVNGSTITAKVGGSVSMTMSSTGIAIVGNVTINGTLTSTGNMKAGSIDMQTHVHGGVQTGSSNTGGPTG